MGAFPAARTAVQLAYETPSSSLLDVEGRDVGRVGGLVVGSARRGGAVLGTDVATLSLRTSIASYFAAAAAQSPAMAR